MDGFEKKLEELLVEEPSEELDNRVLQVLAQARAKQKGRPERCGIPVWAAAAAALFLGVLGFAAGRLIGGGGTPQEAPRESVDFRMALDRGEGKLDFSTTADPLPRGRVMSSLSMEEER